MWLCMAVDMGMTIIFLWKPFSYGVKIDHHEIGLVSESSWDEFLLIASTMILQLTP